MVQLPEYEVILSTRKDIVSILLMKPKLPSLKFNRYFAAIIIFACIPVTVGVMYEQGSSTDITVLTMPGAPHGIVFIADPHLRDANMDHIHEVIATINAMHPSVVLIGGDFVYGDEEDFSLQEVWKEIDAPVYAVLGNHDYKAGDSATAAIERNIALRGADLDPDHYDLSCMKGNNSADYAYADNLAAALEKDGVHVLRNEYVEMEIDGKTLCIVGVDDGWAGMADPPKVPKGDDFVIYMIHEPECRADWDADLILAGHTHGGQFIPPGLDSLASDGLIRLSGMINDDNHTRTYITRGLGTSNLEFELRLFATPEIVVINP
jgi:predicted MPP superfamily phosphohydrolase